MRMKITACVCLLLASAALNPAIAQKLTSTKDISLTIDRHPGWMGDDYIEGDEISIRCTFRNTGNKKVTFLLADHDDYHGTMPYPAFMQARVIDAYGVVLTKTIDSRDGWWTSYITHSDSFNEMPGDRITLKPKESVVRIVPLRSVLAGLPGMREGSLAAGEYKVQLRLDEIVSNEMKIKIVPKSSAMYSSRCLDITVS
jgi:hypothetical protein